MSIIMPVVTSRRDVGFTMCSYQRSRIKLGSALILILIIFFHLPEECGGREYLPAEHCLIEDLEVYQFGGTTLFGFGVIFGLIY